jgi:hypothetical protein
MDSELRLQVSSSGVGNTVTELGPLAYLVGPAGALGVPGRRPSPTSPGPLRPGRCGLSPAGRTRHGG